MTTNTPVTHDCTNGKNAKSVQHGDYMQFDDGLYQVRGFGNKKQIWKVYTAVTSVATEQ